MRLYLQASRRNFKTPENITCGYCSLEVQLPANDLFGAGCDIVWYSYHVRICFILLTVQR